MVLAVSMDRLGRSVVEDFRRRFRLTFPHLLDQDHHATRTYGVHYTPTTFLVDKRGDMVAMAVGLRSWADEEFLRVFDAMLEED